MLQVLGGVLVAVTENLSTEINFRDKIVFIELIILSYSQSWKGSQGRNSKPLTTPIMGREEN